MAKIALLYFWHLLNIILRKAKQKLSRARAHEKNRRSLIALIVPSRKLAARTRYRNCHPSTTAVSRNGLSPYLASCSVLDCDRGRVTSWIEERRMPRQFSLPTFARGTFRTRVQNRVLELGAVSPWKNRSLCRETFAKKKQLSKKLNKCPEQFIGVSILQLIFALKVGWKITS